MERRVCVQECPTPEQNRLQCVPTRDSGCFFTNTTGFEVNNYANYPNPTRSGYFCYPEDEKLREELLSNSQLSSRDHIYNSIDTIKLCFYISLAFCMAYLIGVQFFPQIMNYAMIVLGCLVIIACIVCILTYKSNENLTELLEVLGLSLLLLIIGVNVWKGARSWKMYGIFLRYAAKVIKERKALVLYIPIFWGILFAFIVIIVLEFTAFWSSGSLVFQKENLFYELEGAGPVVWTVLLAIQAIWGFSFIKSSFNFCISAQVVNWHYKKDPGFFYPFQLLLMKHLGTVIAGSFMTGFFALPDFLLDTVKPNKNKDTAYSQCYNKYCSGAISLFDLVREDALVFVNMTANPYCNSSRYCEYLCGRTCVFDYTQTTSRIYRVCSHAFLTGLMMVVALYVKGSISLSALLFLAIIVLFSSTLFVSFHADVAEAAQMSFLIEEEFTSRRHNKNDSDILNDSIIKDRLGHLNLDQDLVKDILDERIMQVSNKQSN